MVNVLYDNDKGGQKFLWDASDVQAQEQIQEILDWEEKNYTREQKFRRAYCTEPK